MPPYRWWRHESSPQPLPSGLALTVNVDGSATISGRPRSTGSRKVSIAVQDSQVVPLTGRPQEYIARFTLRVEAAPITP